MNMTDESPSKPDTPKPGWILLTGTVLLVLISTVLSVLNEMLQGGSFPQVCGAAAAPSFWAAVLALLFSISPRFRNPRSKAKVVLWTSFLFFIGTLCSYATKTPRALEQVAQEINAKGPNMADPTTRVEGAKAGPGRLLTITTTFVEVDGRTVDRVKWERTVRPQVRENILKILGVQKMLKSGITVTYHILGKDNVLIDDVKLTGRDIPKKN